MVYFELWHTWRLLLRRLCYGFLRDSNYAKKKSAFRSPDLYYGGSPYACYVADGGNGGRWNIDSSYGRSSPGTRDGIFSFHVDYGGVVGNYYQHVDGSYGMIYTANNKFKFRSPDLDSGSNDYAYHVHPDGDVDTYWPVDGDVFF